MKERVKILRNVENKYVEATILPITPRHIEEIELIWKPQLKHNNCWDQNLDFRTYFQKGESDTKFYVLECNCMTQGVICLTSNYLSMLEPSKNLLYLNLLNVAPWNRLEIQDPPDFKGVGTTLTTFAVTHSINFGFQGRIGLHSVEKAEKFYEKMHFVNLGHDISHQNLKYLELPKDDAELVVLNYLLLCNLN